MSGCHEPKENISDLIREYMFFVDQSFKSLEKLIKLNEAGLNKCFEWIEKLEANYDFKRDTRKDLNDSLSAIQDDYKNKIEKHEQEINSVIGQLEGLSDHIEKVHDLVNLEDRVTASDVLNRLTSLETHKNYQTEENRKVSKRMNEFEKQILETRVQFIGELGNKKIPHKCPICEGKGKYQSLNPEPPYVLHNLCETCEGKGIIWN